jgi:hypothetical protein
VRDANSSHKESVNQLSILPAIFKKQRSDLPVEISILIMPFKDRKDLMAGNINAETGKIGR